MLAVALGALIGIILGLTGAGGGILAVPALTLVLGWSMTQASPIALLAVGIAAAFGAAQGLRAGLVRYRAATLIALMGILAAPFGQHLAHSLAERMLAIIFAGVMLIVAARLWRNASTQCDDGEGGAITRVRKIQMHTGRIVWNATSFTTLAIIGLLTGLTTGLLGVGGGFIIVPALLRCSEITLAGIVATSLMVITLVSGGAIVSAWMTGNIALNDSAVYFILGTTIGMLLGRRVADRIPRYHTLRFFALVIAVVSLVLIVAK